MPAETMEPTSPTTDKTHQRFEEYGVELTNQGRVAWSTGSKQHPRNWSAWSKWYTVVVVIWLESFTTAISSAGTATSKDAAREYGTTTTVGILCFVTVYMIGQALGGIFLPPISELFGRRTIYIIGTTVFGLASVITGVPHHLAAATIGRFIQGIAAAIPATVAFGNVHDMYGADARVWVVYSYTLFGMAGLALGPIYSSYVTALLGWRWVYYISAIVSGVSAIAACFIRESNADQLLQARTSQLRKLSGDTTLQADSESQGSVKEASIKTFLQSQLLRPLHFLVTEPIVTLCAILCGLAFSLLYACTESLTIIYTTPPFDRTFNTTPKASLPFLAILLGVLLNILPRIYDHINLSDLRRLRQRITPESKIHSVVLACPLLAIGLWILAWTVPPRVTTAPWPLSMLGLVCIGFAANDFSYVLFGYVTDAYGAGGSAASAVGAVALARTLAAGIFPLFVAFMYEGVGNTVATTIIAVAATVFCFAPWLFLEKGAALRKKSPWAAKGAACLWEENTHLRGGSRGSGGSGGDVEAGSSGETVGGGGGAAVEMSDKPGSPRDQHVDSDDDTVYLSAPSLKSSTRGGTRGSTRLSMRPAEKVGSQESTTWSETQGPVTWTYTRVKV